jgi:hypothetical protein
LASKAAATIALLPPPCYELLAGRLKTIYSAAFYPKPGLLKGQSVLLTVFSIGIFSSGQYLHVLLSSLLTDVYLKLICHPLK